MLLARLASLLLLIATIAVPATASAKAGPLPDLRVTTKVAAPSVQPGAKVAVQVTLRNAGRAKAGATTTRISVGASSKTYTKGDRTLATVRQSGVARGQRTTAKTTIKVPAGAKGSVVACADSGRRVRESAEGDNCVRVARVDAKDKGTVDGQAAAKAKPKDDPVVYAPTTPPSKTRDRDPSKDCDVNLDGAQVPQDPQNWNSTLAKVSQVRFYWPKSRPVMESRAKSLATELDGVIYPKLTGLMKVKPLADDNVICNHGGDGLLDVYLVDVIDTPWDQGEPGQLGGSMGTTVPYQCRKKRPTPTFMYLARQDKETLAHEFFHVLQFAYGFQGGCLLPPWIAEGTAEWAVEYVYKHSLTDESSSSWMQTVTPALTTLSYQAWPYWYEVAKRADQGEHAIQQLFTLLGTQTPEAAADTASGTFATRWHEFARDAVNQDPVKTFATPEWTKTTLHPDTRKTLPLGAQPLVGGVSLDPLARYYDMWTINPAVRRVTISGLPTSPDYQLHAYVRMAGGGWEDYPVASGKTWCRDTPGEDVQELILVSSNASVSAKTTGAAKITGEDQCALPHYKVLSASFDNHVDGSMSGDVYCGSVHGTEDYGGTLAAPKTDPAFKLAPSYGNFLDAYINFDIETSGVKANDGCKDEGGHRVECHLSGPWNPFWDKSRMGVHLRVDRTNPTLAKLEWMTHEASIGAIDYGDDNCNIFEFRNDVPEDQRTVDIALDDVKRGKHTYTISKSTKWDIDLQTGKPAAIKMGWSYTITLQVVDAAGNPID
jgi:hypothetical protein